MVESVGFSAYVKTEMIPCLFNTTKTRRSDALSAPDLRPLRALDLMSSV